MKSEFYYKKLTFFQSSNKLEGRKSMFKYVLKKAKRSWDVFSIDSFKCCKIRGKLA